MSEEQNSNENILRRKVEQYQRNLLGERYVGKSLEKLEAGIDESEQQKIMDFMNAKKHFLVFCGNPGLGKTHLCACLFEYVISSFNSFRYWTEYELFKRLRNKISDGRGDYIEELKYLLDDDFIFLDDIGSSGWNEWREEILFSAIDNRYSSMKPTLITSNLSKSEFQKTYHPRLISRIFNKENYIIDIQDGIDFRTLNER